MKLIVGVGIVACLMLGCDADRMSKLEKDNSELKAKLEKKSTAENFEFQATCSKAARTWFNQNWERDKDTILLDFSNHYDAKLNKCFILVEYHYTINSTGSYTWTNHQDLSDVYENAKYAEFVEMHYTFSDPQLSNRDQVITCEVQGQKCKSSDEFYGLIRTFLND